MADDELLYFNGINGASGAYTTMPLTSKQLSKAAQGDQIPEGDLKELRHKMEQELEHRGDPKHQKWAIKEGHDPKDLAQAGWGVIFPTTDEKATAALREALKPLLDHRCAQATKAKDYYYKEFIGPKGVQPNEGKRDFLARHEMGTSGPVDPEKAPYYLLIAGNPDAIPYRFQFLIDVQYAVGRIHFDTLEEYYQYAQNVVRLETQPPFLTRSASFFGTANPNDRATKLSAEKLVAPLAQSAVADQPSWKIKTLPPAETTKAQLAALLNEAAQMPAFLFAATHGMGFPKDDTRQLKHQGALLCQDWPGPLAWKKPIPEDFYVSADDIASTTNLAGLIALFFACYGCGTPKMDEFAHQVGEKAEIAPYSFLANLPRQMLLQGALAVIGHVERAWGTSFMWGNSQGQLAVFESTLKRLMEGHPVGSATEYFNGRYAEMSSELTDYLSQYEFFPETMDPEKVSELWTANNDARGYIVVGDPAVRMPVQQDGGAIAERPTLASLVSRPPQAAPAVPSGSKVASVPEALAQQIGQALQQVLTDTSSLRNVKVTSVDVTDLQDDPTFGDFGGKVRVKAKAGRADNPDQTMEVEINCQVRGKS